MNEAEDEKERADVFVEWIDEHIETVNEAEDEKERADVFVEWIDEHIETLKTELAQLQELNKNYHASVQFIGEIARDLPEADIEAFILRRAEATLFVEIGECERKMLTIRDTVQSLIYTKRIVTLMVSKMKEGEDDETT